LTKRIKRKEKAANVTKLVNKEWFEEVPYELSILWLSIQDCV